MKDITRGAKRGELSFFLFESKKITSFRHFFRQVRHSFLGHFGHMAELT